MSNLEHYAEFLWHPIGGFIFAKKSSEFLLPIYFDFAATFLWALSGAMLAARHGYAFLGILTMAVVSSTGGGLLRDGIFLQNGPPLLLRSPVYLGIICLAVFVVILFGRFVQKVPYFNDTIATVDALGLGAYAVVGMSLAFDAGLSPMSIVVVGMVNAVGGGFLRDLLMSQEPKLFTPGTLEGTASLIGCVFFLLMVLWIGLSHYQSAWITIILVFIIRLLAIRYNIQSRPLSAFQQKLADKDHD